MRTLAIWLLSASLVMAGASRGFGTDSCRVSVAASPPSYPFTVCGWVRLATSGALQVLISIHDDANPSTTYWKLVANASDEIRGYTSVDPGPFRQTGSAGTATAAAWQHWAFVCTDATTRVAYLDGNASTTDTNNLTPSSIDSMWLGSDTSGNSVGARVAHVAWWNKALSQAEIDMLVDAGPGDPHGIPPNGLHHALANLVAYWPLDEEGTTTACRDNHGALDMAVTGSTTDDHDGPPVWDP